MHILTGLVKRPVCGKGMYGNKLNDKYRMLAEEMERLKKIRLAENYEQRVKDMNHYLNTHTNGCMEYDDKLVQRLVVQVRILTADKIQIQLGIILEQGLYINRNQAGMIKE